jgi:hypothetical protein
MKAGTPVLPRTSRNVLVCGWRSYWDKEPARFRDRILDLARSLDPGADNVVTLVNTKPAEDMRRHMFFPADADVLGEQKWVHANGGGVKLAGLDGLALYHVCASPVGQFMYIFVVLHVHLFTAVNASLTDCCDSLTTSRWPK